VGWEKWEGATLSDEAQTDTVPEDAVLGLVEPRVACVLASRGAAKPYAAVGAATRFYGPYLLPDLGDVAFDPRPNGIIAGPLLAAGIGVDPSERASIFVEVPWAPVLTPQATSSGPDELAPAGEAAHGMGHILGLRLGAGARW
jgi:hypothetical protein